MNLPKSISNEELSSLTIQSDVTSTDGGPLSPPLPGVMENQSFSFVHPNQQQVRNLKWTVELNDICMYM